MPKDHEDLAVESEVLREFLGVDRHLFLHWTQILLDHFPGTENGNLVAEPILLGDDGVLEDMLIVGMSVGEINVMVHTAHDEDEVVDFVQVLFQQLLNQFLVLLLPLVQEEGKEFHRSLVQNEGNAETAARTEHAHLGLFGIEILHFGLLGSLLQEEDFELVFIDVLDHFELLEARLEGGEDLVQVFVDLVVFRLDSNILGVVVAEEEDEVLAAHHVEEDLLEKVERDFEHFILLAAEKGNDSELEHHVVPLV